MMTKYGDKILVIIVQGMACHQFGAWTNDDVLSIGTLEINLC